MRHNNPFEVTYTNIEGLSDDDLVNLLNTLLDDEAFRLQLPQGAVLTTLAINDPDGGIDALSDNTTQDTRHLPIGRTVWQVKKGWISRLELEGELRKPAAAAILATGGNYILVVGTHTTPNKLLKRKKELEEAAKDLNYSGAMDILSADLLARWASTVPPARLALRQQLWGFITAEMTLEEGIHEVPFVADVVRQAVIDSIKSTLFEERRAPYHARIEGEAGIGKTRLALELIRHLGLASITLYSANIPTDEFFSWCAQNRQMHGTLIVDECDLDQVARLERWARLCEGRLLIISVGPGIPSTHSNGQTYVLTILEQDAVADLVRRTQPVLDEIQARRIAQMTQGYLKLTLAVADAVARLGATSLLQIRDERTIQHQIIRLIIPDNPEAHRALRGVALLAKLGWQGTVAAEGQRVAEFLGMSWNAMRDALTPAMQRGLVVTRGRYWYVSPELLALWLAAEVWEQHPSRIKELMDLLPSPASEDALLARLNQLGDVPVIQEILGGMLDQQGFFRGIDDLDSPADARLFAALAKGAPEAATARLARIINSTSLERLQTFGPGRRQVLWTLESLVFRQETFYTAARLVRRLAEAENESFGNNATGVWKNLFLTFLGQTEVPASDRLVLVKEAISAETPTLRLLAIQAVDAALERQESATVQSQPGIIPRPHWRPQTRDEVRQFKLEALTILRQGLTDEDEAVRKAARSVLSKRARPAMEQGLADEVITLLNDFLGEEDEEQQRWLGISIRAVLKMHREQLTEDQQQQMRALLERVYGTSLADRIKRYTGQGSWAEWADEEGGAKADPQQLAITLADEALHHPDEVHPLLGWLTSSAAVHIWPFAYQLGQLDVDKTWLEPLLEAVQQSGTAMALGAYLAGRADAGEHGWREDLLDAWAQHPHLAKVVLDATRVSRGTDHAARRILALVDHGWLDANALHLLGYGAWVSSLSAGSLITLVERILNAASQQAVEAASLMLLGWLDAPDHPLQPSVKDLLWRMLEEPSGWSVSPGAAYSWEELARRLLTDNPPRLAQLIIQTMIAQKHPEIQRILLLEEVLKVAPHDVWPVIGDVLLSKGQGSYLFIWAVEESNLLSTVPFAVVQAWVEERGAEAAARVAQALKPGGVQVSHLVRFLLREYSTETGSTLYANFISGGWVGSQALYLQEKLALAEGWLQDEEPAVQEWAQQVVTSINSDLKQVRLQEEEDELGYQ